MVLSINIRARIAWRADQGWSWRKTGNDVGCDHEKIENLALSMPKSYREVLDKNGGSSHY
jgi:hypothetical protein